MDSKDKVINDLLSRIAKLEYEVERLEKRNKEIYEGFMATTEELCEATKEIEKLKEQLNDEIDEELKQSEIMVKKQKEIERLHSIIKEAREYIENNTYKIEWGDLEQDNEDINISEDLTDREFIENILEILDKELKNKEEK